MEGVTTGLTIGAVCVDHCGERYRIARLPPSLVVEAERRCSMPGGEYVYAIYCADQLPENVTLLRDGEAVDAAAARAAAQPDPFRKYRIGMQAMLPMDPRAAAMLNPLDRSTP